MYKIALCDDEPIVREQLYLYLRHMEEAGECSFDITCFSGGEALLEGMQEDTQIVLLDIRMGGMSGLETARRLRERDQKLCIIFITTMVHCALEGYGVHAFGFLVKPLEYEAFQKLMQDAIQVLGEKRQQMLTLKSQDETVVYDQDEILYIQVYGRIVNVVTKTDSREFYTTLKEIERQVDAQCFVRCHVSFLVNCRHIKKIASNEITMANGQRITLSKHRKAKFMEQFSRYVRGECL